MVRPKVLLVPLRTLAVLGALTFQMACLPYHPTSSFVAKDLDVDAKTFQSVQNRSVAYVYREKTESGKRRWFDILLDRRWVGKPPIGSYFRLVIQPGAHMISTFGDYDSHVEMSVEPGKIYFVAITWRQPERAAGLKGLTWNDQWVPKLLAVSETEGRAGVLNCELINGKVK